MARTFRRKKTLDALTEINVTPLIDLAFALLIIFMITTPLLEQSIELELPKEDAKSQATDPVDAIVVEIAPDGKFYWNGEALNDVRVEEEIRHLAGMTDPPVISIRADRRLQYQRVIDLLDLVKKHKLTKISLETNVE